MNEAPETWYPYPVFLNLTGKRCVVIGGGNIATRKMRELVDAGADVCVVAGEPSEEVRRLHEEKLITLETRCFRESDVEGAFLVFAATNDRTVNESVFNAADKRSIPVNVVDIPDLCNFYSGSVVKRGPLRIAISTSGCCPAYAKSLRRELEYLIPETYEDYITQAGVIRRRIIDEMSDDPQAKHAALTKLADKDMFNLYLQDGIEAVWEELRKINSSS